MYIYIYTYVYYYYNYYYWYCTCIYIYMSAHMYTVCIYNGPDSIYVYYILYYDILSEI